MTKQESPTVWVCLACFKWSTRRDLLKDVACILKAREFKRDEVQFDPDNPKVILRIQVGKGPEPQ